MTELYQVVRYNRVLFEGSKDECKIFILLKVIEADLRYPLGNLQIWKKSVREYLNKNWR